MRCEGFVKPGSFMTLGPRSWIQCKKDGIVLLEVDQDGKVEKLPACADCWQKVKDNDIKIISVEPILPESEDE